MTTWASSTFPGVPTHLTFAEYDHLDFAVLLAFN